MAIERNENEEKYFAEVEAQLRRELRVELDQKAHKLAEASKIAATLAVDDATLAARVHELGFDGETARVFDVLPLVHVAWADGKVHREERTMILDLVAGRGVAPGTAAFRTIEALLEERPTDTFMHESIELLRAIAQRSGRSHDIVQQCIEIADASGGILGLGRRVTSVERDAILAIATRLQVGADQVAHLLE